MTVKTHEPPLATRDGLLFAVKRTPGRAPPKGATVQLPQADEAPVYAAVNVAFGWYMQTDRSAAPVRLDSVKASESGAVAEAAVDGDVVTTSEPIVPEAVAVFEPITAGAAADAEAYNVNVEPVAPVIRYLHRKDAVAPTASEGTVVGVGPERSTLPPGAVIVGVTLPSETPVRTTVPLEWEAAVVPLTPRVHPENDAAVFPVQAICSLAMYRRKPAALAGKFDVSATGIVVTLASTAEVSVVVIPPFVTSSRTVVSPPEMTDAGSRDNAAESVAIVTVGELTSIDVAVAPFCARPRK